MSGGGAEIAHYVAQTKGVEVLFKDACSSTCDGCGASPRGENDQLSICRDPTGGYEGTLYLCNDCIAESWARAPSQRDLRSAEEIAAEAKEREHRKLLDLTAEVICTNPAVRESLRRLMAGDASTGIVTSTEAEVLVGEGV